MVRYNLTRYLSIIVVLSVAIFLLVSILKGELDFEDLDKIWNNIATTITVVSFVSWFYISYAWKWMCFRGWLVPFPCLSGEWSGNMVSTYDNKTRPVTISINHTFFHISVKYKTDESSSNSTCACFDIDRERGYNHLVYSYMNEPKAQSRGQSSIHYGTARLEISKDAKTLEGYYWTDRKTTGDITFRKDKHKKENNS